MSPIPRIRSFRGFHPGIRKFEKRWARTPAEQSQHCLVNVFPLRSFILATLPENTLTESECKLYLTRSGLPDLAVPFFFTDTDNHLPRSAVVPASAVLIIAQLLTGWKAEEF